MHINSAKEVLEKILDKFFAGELEQNFIIISPDLKDIRVHLEEKIAEKLGKNIVSDYLFLPDLTQKLGKKHSLKVENDEILEIDGQIYKDWGIREIINWLNSTSLSSYKILFIQNFERATISAMNAFLKTTEEFFADTLIFVTINSQTAILPTLVSRGFLVRITDLEIGEFDYGKLGFLPKSAKEVIIQAAQLGKNLVKNMEIEEFENNFLVINDFFVKQEKKQYSQVLEALIFMEKKGFLKIIFDLLVAQLNDDGQEINYILEAKKNLDLNLVGGSYLLKLISDFKS